MKRIALMTLALAMIVGTANAEPVVGVDRAASKFNLFPAELSVSITGLPLFPGGGMAFAQGVNGNGEVVGFGTTDSNQIHAFYWSPSNPDVLVDIDPLGGDMMQAFGINDNGVVVGYKADIDGIPQAFKWDGSTQSKLSPLSGYSGSLAAGINNAGQVVGWSVVGSPSQRATLWEANGTPVDLGASLGAGVSRARSINGNGHVTGDYTKDGSLHAFLWTPGSGVTDLGTLGGSESNGWSLSGDGWIVGNAKDLNGVSQAFLSNGIDPMVSLEPDAMSLASGLNGTPHAVGFSTASGSTRPILWGPNGLRQDLATLDGSTSSFGIARAINETGQVVGMSQDQDNDGNKFSRATLWTLGDVTTPPPPPATSCDTSLEAQIDCLIALVESMEGVLNEGQARSMMAKLEAAKKTVRQAEEHAARGRAGAAEGNLKAARNIVNALRHQVHAFVLAGILTAQDEDEVAKIINP